MLFLLESVLDVADLLVLLVDVLLMFALQLQELLLCLKNLLLLDALSFQFRFLDYFFLLPLEQDSADEYVCYECKYSTQGSKHYV